MRRFIDLCFARPVAVTALFLLLGALAVTAWIRIPVSLLPDLRYPALMVWTAYSDVPPDRVERAVTERIEEAVASVSGLQRITSRSQLGGSLVRIDLDWNTNLDLALLDVREQIDRLGESLPVEAERPAVLRIDPSERPMMVLSFRSPDTGTSLTDLKRIAEDVVARRIEQLDGVARVRVTGGFDRQVDIVLDPARMAAFGVTLDGVRNALAAANVQLPGGFIMRGPFRYVVEVSGEFRHTQDIADAVIDYDGDLPIRTSDIADVRESNIERRGLVRLDGTETLLLLVERRPDANTVRTAAEVRGAIEVLRTELPRVSLDVLIDDSEFIEQSIDGVAQAVLLGGVLAVLVLLFFLRRLRPLLAVAVAIPLSLGIAFVFFDVLDVSFNLISLSGLALGVGMLVDNGIVVVENIARLRQTGVPLADAGRQGTAEVASAITASTLTTIAVFLPITFVEGLAGRLFRDQSLAVVCALAASLLVALTVVPLIAARGRGRNDESGMMNDELGVEPPPRATDEPSPRPSGALLAYERALGWCLDHRGVVSVAALVLVAVALVAAIRLPREVVPATEQGRVELHLTMPSDSDLPLVSARAERIERVAAAQPDVLHVLADLGERDEARLELEPRPPYEGDVILIIEEGERALPVANAVLAQVGATLGSEVAVEVRPVRTQLEALLTRGQGDLLVDLVAEDRRDAESVVDSLIARLQASDALRNVHRFDFARVPAYRVTFRRDAIARFGVTASALTAHLEAAGRGRRATELRTVNESVPIVLRARHLGSVEALLGARIRTRSGLLPMSAFVEVEQVELPSDLVRIDQASVVRIVADLAPGADLRAAGTTVQSAFDDILPVSVRGTLHGANDAFNDGLRALGISLLLSVLLVYLILAAQFESLLQPAVILLAVPLAAAGVVLALWITGQSINLMSLTGCVVLVGIVVNDAIIKVDFINQRRESGLGKREAILAAGRDRARPIVMTTVTTVLGLLPLALGFGSGAELRAPLAIAIVGGIVSATVLTLFVVPVVYSLVQPD